MRAPIRLTSLAVAAVMLAAGCGAATPSAAPAVVSPTPPAASATVAPGAACTPATTPTAHDWNERTWYELFVRSFADGDGDGIGDFKGLTAKLDYLNDGDPTTTTDLGVGGLWLMPVAESPSYHGYDVTDYRAVEPDYGTKADFLAFIAAAHERGIKVIVDLVMNHTASDNAWFTASATRKGAKADWYVWSDDNPGWLGPGGQVAWHPLDNRWYYGVFSDAMPDLNLRNDAVTAELKDVARYWLADMGVDGFRLDAAKHLIEDGKDAQTNTPETHAWLAGFKASVDAVNPGAMLVGEVWDPASVAGGYVPASLDLTFDFGLAAAYRVALQNGRAAPLRTALLDTAAAWPANQDASFLTNHDQTRIMTELRGDPAAAKLAAFLLLTGPGTPFLYYGEEIGMTGTKPDERIRTPMRWTADPATAGFTTGTPWEALSDDDPATVNVAAQAADRGSLLAAYQDLVRVRGQQPALRDGGTTLVDSDAEPVIGWLRTTADATILALVNVSDQPVEGYTLTLRDGPFCGPEAATLLGSVNGDPATSVSAPRVNAEGGVDAWTPVATLPPRTGFLVSLAPAP
ncbi:MAG TPA: alpha-amylase family glycosyl hydrolase [Candidatus Limnocylindrales bacterium]|jgi:glycosidase